MCPRGLGGCGDSTFSELLLDIKILSLFEKGGDVQKRDQILLYLLKYKQKFTPLLTLIFSPSIRKFSKDFSLPTREVLSFWYEVLLAWHSNAQSGLYPRLRSNLRRKVIRYLEAEKKRANIKDPIPSFSIDNSPDDALDTLRELIHNQTIKEKEALLISRHVILGEEIPRREVARRVALHRALKKIRKKFDVGVTPPQEACPSPNRSTEKEKSNV